MRSRALKSYLMLAAFSVIARAGAVFAADETMPALRPPRGEMQAGFWEKYGWTVVIGIVVVLGGISLFIQWYKRKRPGVLLPPEVVIKRSLQELRGQNEDATLALKVSCLLRNYLGSVFQFPAGEYTTSEVSKTLKEQAKLDLAMPQEIERFLRRCDERKFSPAATATQFDSVEDASDIVEKVEAHRKKVAAEAEAQAKMTTTT